MQPQRVAAIGVARERRGLQLVLHAGDQAHSGIPAMLAAEDVPVQMEDGLTGALTDVDQHAVVLEARLACGVRDELEHPLRLVRRKLADLAEGRDVPLGQDEQMRVGARVDVADRDEAVALRNVVARLRRACRRGSPHGSEDPLLA